MWSKEFWVQAVERAVKTAAQTGLAFFIVGQTDLLTLDWAVIGSGVGVATVASILTSIASAGVGPKDTPSVVKVGE